MLTYQGNCFWFLPCTKTLKALYSHMLLV